VKLTLRGIFEWTPRTLGLVVRASPGGATALGVLTLGTAIVPLAIAYVGKCIVDAVVAKDPTATLDWVGLELGLVALLALFSQGLSLARQIVGARLGLDVNVMILEKATRLPLRQFEDSEFYDRLTRARREASSRPLSVVVRAFQIVQSGLSLLGYAALLSRFSGWAVAALLVAAIPATISEVRFSNQAFRIRNWRSSESRKLMYLEHVLGNDQHAKEVQLLGLGRPLLDRYQALGEGFFREDRELAVRRGRFAYALSLLATVALYAAYAVMALSAAQGLLSLGELTLNMVAFRQGQQAFQALLGALSGMYEDNLYMSNLFAYLDDGESKAAESHEQPRALPEAVVAHPPSELGIRFEDVGFQYPKAQDFALRHISLFVPHGQCLALVGQNGAGKSTFIKLLTRLYEPTEGRILLDGVDLRAWDPVTLRARISVVFQDFAQYQLTARENVGFGDVNRLPDTMGILEAAERGGADGLFSGLKDGVDTQLGRWFKDGVELSGGQWQKVALSRAFMRDAADILVLDEPTAALDAEAEHVVFERFRELTRGKTSIVISHRFPTVRMADRILVVDHGQVVEEGTHAELVAGDGRYAHWFALQAQGYG
jgi:ATP-binding cassette, subfamily B, bacterial